MTSRKVVGGAGGANGGNLGKSFSEKLVGAGAFLVFFGAYLLFFRGPATNQKQQYFRIGVVVVGVVLGVVGLVLKTRGGRGGPR